MITIYLRSSNLVRDAFEGKFAKINIDLTKEIMAIEAINALHWEQGELVDVAVPLVDSRGKIYFLKKGTLPVQSPDR